MLPGKVTMLQRQQRNFLRLFVRRNLSQTEPKLEETAPKIGFYQWFSSPRGQKFVGYSFIVGSVAAAGGHLSLHSLLLNFVKDFFQQYTGGTPTKVSSQMLELLNEVVQDLSLSPEEADRIKFFVLSQPEPMGWGDLSKAALVGYPLYFHYKKIEEVPLERMYFGIQSTDKTSMLTPGQLKSPEARLFCESMILSADAKKFAIAREVETIRMLPQLVSAALASSLILVTLYTARLINTKLNLYRRPPLLRGINYLSILPTISLLFVTSKDGHRRLVEGRADSRAAAVSPAYAAGGVEYYSSIMQRNKALRVLHANGQAMYNLHGELVPGLIRLRTKPLQKRRTICQDRLTSLAAAAAGEIPS